MNTGIKEMDALHVASAILTGSNYFITTDDRVLRYTDERIKIINSCDFVRNIRQEETMNNTVEILNRGFNCLVEHIGVVDAEIFISTINKEKFDYTVWRKKYFSNQSLEDLNKKAVAYAKKNGFKGKAKKM